jgi:hypothetical protein
MEIDKSQLSPAELQQAQMFEMMLGSMPDDAIRFFISLFEYELAERAAGD